MNEFAEFNIRNKELYKDPTYDNDNKTGRNDPCPCGSGKKYKKCCKDSGMYSTGSFVSLDEYYNKKIQNNILGSSKEEIQFLDLGGLKQLNIGNLNLDQLKIALYRSIELADYDMAISFIQDLRKYYTAENGFMFVPETKLIVAGEQVIFDEENESYDDILLELVISMEKNNKTHMVELLTGLYFDKSTIYFNYSQFLVALSKNDTN